jgi:rubrerythrin
MMPSMTLHDCVALAVELERAGALFYARMANEFAQHAPVRELLLSLAEDERVHEDQFEALRARAAAAGRPCSLPAQHLRALAVHRFFTGPSSPLLALQQAATVTQALHVALAFERDTLQAFEQLRDGIADEPAAALLDQIIETERNHVLRLQSLVR